MVKRWLVFYDRSGRQITEVEWCKLLSNHEYVYIRETRGALRKEPWEVVTLWHGSAIRGATPRLFKTVVRVKGTVTDVIRSESLETALYFHRLFVREKWREEDDVV